MKVNEIIQHAQQKMNETVEHTRKELAALRTGRASLAMLDGIAVEYYGTPTPLNQVATLTIPDPTLIVAQPWDVRSEEHTSELQSRPHLVCRLLLAKKKNIDRL